jgi:hypothetical protein
MSEIQTICAIIHEIAHAKLHDINALREKDANVKPKDQETKEIESESIAFTCSCYYGIETDKNSFGYIAEFSRNRELPELKASLEIIRKTAAEMIDSIDEKFMIIAKERGIDFTAEVPEHEITQPEHTEPLYFTETQTTPEQDEIDQFAIAYYRSTLDTYRHGIPRDNHEQIEKDIERIADLIRSGKTDGIREGLERQIENSPFPAKVVMLLEQLEKITEQMKTENNHETDIIPDPAIEISERDKYGYTNADILPLLREKALELFDKDHTIYMLYPDNTEAMIFERDEILNHDGIFGIESSDWLKSKEYAEILKTVTYKESSQESELIYGKTDMFGIYQLKTNDETYYLSFKNLTEILEKGLSVDRKNYDLVYINSLNDFPDLKSIYNYLNEHRPENFTGRGGIFTSDIIVLQKDGLITSHYVEKDGFKNLPAFIGNEKQQVISNEIQNQLTEKTPLRFTDKLEVSKISPQKPDNKKKSSILGDLENNKILVAQGKTSQKNQMINTTGRDDNG